MCSGRRGVDQEEEAGRHQHQAAGVPRQVQEEEVLHQGKLMF